MVQAICEVGEDNWFSNINTISELSQKKETWKDHCYPLVYWLLKLLLVLPISTTTVERCLSGMKIVKTSLSNCMGDTHLSNRLIFYVKKRRLKCYKWRCGWSLHEHGRKKTLILSIRGNAYIFHSSMKHSLDSLLKSLMVCYFFFKVSENLFSWELHFVNVNNLCF